MLELSYCACPFQQCAAAASLMAMIGLFVCMVPKYAPLHACSKTKIPHPAGTAKLHDCVVNKDE